MTLINIILFYAHHEIINIERKILISVSHKNLFLTKRYSISTLLIKWSQLNKSPLFTGLLYCCHVMQNGLQQLDSFMKTNCQVIFSVVLKIEKCTLK